MTVCVILVEKIAAGWWTVHADDNSILATHHIQSWDTTQARRQAVRIGNTTHTMPVLSRGQFGWIRQQDLSS